MLKVPELAQREHKPATRKTSATLVAPKLALRASRPQSNCACYQEDEEQKCYRSSRSRNTSKCRRSSKVKRHPAPINQNLKATEAAAEEAAQDNQDLEQERIQVRKQLIRKVSLYESDGEGTCRAFNEDVKAIDNFLNVHQAKDQALNSHRESEKRTTKVLNADIDYMSSSSRTLSTQQYSELLETNKHQNCCMDLIGFETDCVLQKCKETMNNAEEAAKRSSQIIGCSKDIQQQLKALSKM